MSEAPSSPLRSRSGAAGETAVRLHRVAQLLESRFGCPVKRRTRRDPVAGMIRTILSQNTTDIQSDKAYESLRARFPRLESLRRAPEQEIAETIRSCGLAGQKSRTIKRFLSWLEKRTNGVQPTGELNADFLDGLETSAAEKELLAIPGVGRKTARCVLLFSCGRDVFPMDTHVRRISARLRLIPPGCSSDTAHTTMDRLVPQGAAHSLHLNMVRLGRTVCKARRPDCPACPLEEICPAAR